MYYDTPCQFQVDNGIIPTIYFQLWLTIQPLAEYNPPPKVLAAAPATLGLSPPGIAVIPAIPAASGAGNSRKNGEGSAAKNGGWISDNINMDRWT